MKKYINNIYIAVLLAVFTVSCDKYLDIKPKDRVIPETLEDYRKLLTSGYASFPDSKAKASVRTDEMTINTYDFSASAYKDIFLWKDSGYDEETSEFAYDLLYRTIFYTNEVIISGGETLENSDEKNQLIGEAHALRAYAYFELVNLFSKPYDVTTAQSEKGVPIVLEIDMENYVPPATLAQVYEQIQKDIDQARILMNIDVQPDETKYRFSKLTLEAFQSRVYLYQKNYEQTLTAVNKVLSSKSDVLDLNANTDGLLPMQITSVENIQALDYAVNNTVNRMAYADENLLALYDQDNDLRFALYYAKDGSHYKTVKGNSENHKCSFRTGELFLVKAEALHKLNRESEAKEVVLTLAKKRYNATGLATFTAKINALSGADFFTELMNERFRETAFEGYRWFDLRRNNQKSITHTYNQITETLAENDPRYTIEFPRSAQEQNPSLID